MSAPHPSPAPIRPSQLAQWRRDGLVVLRDFASPQTCRQLRDRAAALIAARAPHSPAVVFETATQSHARADHFADSAARISLFYEADDPATVNKIGHALHERDPVFAAFSQQPRLIALLQALGMPRPRLVQSMYLCKAPRVGGAVSAHQDASFLRTAPDTVIGLWLALHDAHRGNGCLWALPGQQRAPLRAVFGRLPDGSLGMTTHDPDPWPTGYGVPVEVPAGSLVVLHGRLPHWSAPNRSDAPREAYAVHAVDAGARWLPENWIPLPLP